MQDLTGKVFGEWTVIKFSHLNKNRLPYWNCKCKCGTIRSVNHYSLINWKSLSCGCTSRERASEKIITHGYSKTRIYKIWKGMKKRCNNQNSSVYKFYGGRGISVCNEWMQSFELFYAWSIANGYKENLSIDRIDVNGNYCPDNCRWVDVETQHTNTRRNHMITIDGKTKILRDWSIESGVPASTIIRRLKDGWLEKDAVFTVPHCGNRYNKLNGGV